MDISDIIALLALLVGSYGAILSTYTAINEFFRLKLSILNPGKTYITLSQDGNYINEFGVTINSYHKDLYSIILLVRITNKSKNSTTINEFILNNKYKLNSSSELASYIPTKFYCQSNNLYEYSSEHLDYPIIKPLLELKPLTSYEGYLVFNNVKEVPSQFNIKINAVQKTKSFKLHFPIANDYRNVRIQK